MSGYEATLQRISDLRALTGATSATSASSSTAVPGAFDAQLQAQQAIIAARSAATGGADTQPETPFSAYGLPVLTAADQIRLLQGASSAPAPAGGVGERMVALATGELGVSEINGSNEAPRIREYRTATAGAEKTPGPWCAYFVSWLAREAGAPIGANGNGTGYVPTLEAWGKQEGRFVRPSEGAPRPGDIVIFNWGGSGPADHTGIVERIGSNGTIYTIEGNSSDAVRRREYPSSSGDIAGYIRM